jgi:hypothetical protein
VHRCRDEAAWWNKAGIDPTETARTLWLKTHSLPNVYDAVGSKLQIEPNFKAAPNDLISADRGELPRGLTRGGGRGETCGPGAAGRPHQGSRRHGRTLR